MNTEVFVAATVAAGKVFDGAVIPPFSLMYVASIDARFRFIPLETGIDDTDNLILLTPTLNPAAGRWVRDELTFDVKMTHNFSLLNNAVMLTIPVCTVKPLRFRPSRLFWEVNSAYSGGVASTIGISSSNVGCNTPGDLLGGAAGDNAATLAVSLSTGTIGTKLAALGNTELVGGDTIRNNLIVSAFTAGKGFVHMLWDHIAN